MTLREEFREYINQERILKDLENYRTLNEMPRIFDGEVTAEFVDKELIKPIQQAAKDKEILDTGVNIENTRLIYIPINKTDYIFALANNKGIIGATKISRLCMIDNELFYMMKITKKLKDDDSF